MFSYQARQAMKGIEHALAMQDSSEQIATANELIRLLKGYVQETREDREIKQWAMEGSARAISEL